jgi:BASS family bile acid:Na+ symporter
MRLSDIFLLAVIFGSIAIAVVHPGTGRVFQPYLITFMMILLFLSFLKIDFHALVDTSGRALFNLATLVAIKLILLPLLLYAAAAVLIPEYAISILLLSGISTGVVAPFIAGVVTADLAPVIRMVIVTSVIVPFSLPCLVKALAGSEITISLGDMIRLLAYVVFIPMGFVLILRKAVPGIMEKIAARQFPLSVLLCALVNLGVFSKYSAFFFQEPRQILASIAIAYVLSIIYYGTGFVLTPKSRVPQRLAAAVSLAIMNNVLVMVFAAGSFGPLPPTLAAMYMLPYYTMLVPVKMLAGRM